jgi:hypothetical protein
MFVWVGADTMLLVKTPTTAVTVYMSVVGENTNKGVKITFSMIQMM